MNLVVHRLRDPLDTVSGDADALPHAGGAEIRAAIGRCIGSWHG